jgi:hypothetical protein
MDSESDSLEDLALHLKHLLVIKLAMTGLLKQDLGLDRLDLLKFRSN